MAIAWLNKPMDNSCTFDDLAASEDCFQVLDRKLAKSSTGILPIALLHEIMLEENVCRNKGYKFTGRQTIMPICNQFQVNADLGSTKGIGDPSVFKPNTCRQSSARCRTGHWMERKGRHEEGDGKGQRKASKGKGELGGLK